MTRSKPSRADVQLLGDKAQARAIMAARSAFNEALVARDLAVIESVLTEDAVLVPGDEAQLIQGRPAQIEAWASIFANMPDVHYVRSPARIEIGTGTGLAAETGRWRGRWSSDGFQVEYSGRYFAKWRHDGLSWRIEAETFVTLKRGGEAGG